MSPVEQHAAYLDVAQPSLPASPGCTGDEPGVAGPAGWNGPVEDASRRHVLPRGGDHEDPGTPAHQAGLGPLEDAYLVAGPVQERRRRAPGDRSADDADSHAACPRSPRSATREVTAICQRSGYTFAEEADGTRPEDQASNVTGPHASTAGGRATAAAASRVAAVRETQSAAGPRAASAVMTAGAIARLKPVDSWNRASARPSLCSGAVAATRAVALP